MQESREEKKMETITGEVEYVSFHSEDTGFTVLELACNNELVTVVGQIPEPAEGEELQCTGTFISHPQYGDQFKADIIERRMPETPEAIYKYLASGAVKGIGAATARKIMDTFGRDSLRIMEQEPDRLTEVRGITAKKAREIGEEYRRIFGIRTVMVYLGNIGLRPEQAVACWKKWGPLTTDIIQSNPYALMAPEIGVSWRICDETLRNQLSIPEDAPCRSRAGLLHVLRANAGSHGHTCIPRKRLLEAAVSLMGLPAENLEETLDKLCAAGDVAEKEFEKGFYCYLPELFDAERYIAERMGVFHLLGSSEGGDSEGDIRQLEEVRGFRYAEAQRRAIRLAMTEPVLILTGGPGTGKTTTLNAIIELLLLRDLKVGLAAPTGRAAKRMSELTGRNASTIHRLLEVDFRSGEENMRFIHDEKNPLSFDAVIIDEMSMVDVPLFAALLKALKLKTRLILVGDSDQLPSVGPGNVLEELIASRRFATVELKEVFRQAAESLIVTNAHRIIEGTPPELARHDRDFFLLQGPNNEITAEKTCGLISERLPKTYKYSPLWDIQILCPTRQGEIGTEALNRRLQELLNPQDGLKRQVVARGVTYREGDKVMQTRNNYDVVWHREGEEGAGVFNGDIGILISVDVKENLYQVRFDDRIAEYNKEMLSELDHAWAITVHKSQGSEFEAVIIPLQNWHDKLYYRKLLYTAVTRAKKMLILVGKESTVLRMVESEKKTVRYTNLAEFLKEEIPDSEL